MHDTVPSGQVAPAPSLKRRIFRLPSRAKAGLIVILIAVIGTAAVLGTGYYQATGVSTDYQAARAKLTSDLGAAQGNGLTQAEIAPIAAQLAAIDSRRPALPSGIRLALDRSDIDALNQLDIQLKATQASVFQTASSDATSQLTAADAALAADKQIGVPDSDLGPLAKRLSDLKGAKASAQSIKDWRDVGTKATAVHDSLVKAGVTQQQENSAIQAAANALVQQTAGNLGAIQQAGTAALVLDRNDASIAAYEAKPGRFPRIDDLMALYNRTEFYAPKLGSGDIKEASYGTAAIQRYGGQVHNMLMTNLGPKHVIVSFQDQHVWAFENGNVVLQTPATTGVRGDTAYGTDFGPMKIVLRSHPWKMHSPFPPGSGHWYPDTVVQWTAFFTNSGEAFHDAAWQSDSTLGPGSQYSAWTRSHGCIHVPYSDAQWMFNWAVEGTPVDVYPGNGQPVAEQLSEMTTADQGIPKNPAG